MTEQSTPSDWLTYAKNMVDKSAKLLSSGNEAIYHFWGHGSEIEKYDQWDRVVDFLEYVDEVLR